MLCNISSIFSKLRARSAGHVSIVCLAICINFCVRRLGGRCNLTAASWIECLVSYAETGICTA